MDAAKCGRSEWRAYIVCRLLYILFIQKYKDSANAECLIFFSFLSNTRQRTNLDTKQKEEPYKYRQGAILALKLFVRDQIVISAVEGRK